MSHQYIFRPKAPLLFGQGRPFGSTDRAHTLPMPRPDTVAGAYRAAVADSWGMKFHKEQQQKNRIELQRISVHGPILVRQSQDGGLPTPLFPKPADSAYLSKQYESAGKLCESGAKLYHLTPGPVGDGEGNSLDNTEKGLWPVRLMGAPEDHSVGDGSAYWRFDRLIQWLADPAAMTNGRISAKALGIDELPVQQRTQIQIDGQTNSAKEGVLFGTQAVEFRGIYPDWPPPHRWHIRGEWPNRSSVGHRYGLLVQSSDGTAAQFRRLGGRGRLTRLASAQGLWPLCPGFLKRSLRGVGGLRLVLATPGLFKHGWRPDWLRWENDGWCGSPPGFEGELTLRLRAVAIQHWQTTPGWDLAEGKAKPLHRAVPAGSVYWFEVETGADALHKLWLQPISDAAPDRNNGFGLVLPGIWKYWSKED